MNVLNKYFGGRVVGKQKIWLLAIIILVTAGCHGFQYVNWPFGNFLFNILLILISYIILINIRFYKSGNFTVLVILFIALPFFSIINSWTLYGQSIWMGLKANFNFSFCWVLYFFLHLFKIKESTIIHTLLYISIFIVAVQVIQQFTYPNALFGLYSEDFVTEKGLHERADFRNGLWRFRIDQNCYFTAPILFFLHIWIKKKINLKLGVFFVLLLVSVYLTLTRQVIFAVLISLFFSFLMNNTKRSYMGYFIIGILLGILVYIYYDTLFGEMSEKTMDDMNKDNIRLYSAVYYWNDSLRDIYTFLFGYGVPGSEGSFHNNVENLHTLGLYAVDVGFIGIIWRFGFIYVALSYYLLYCIFFKYKKFTPMYIRLFVIFVFSMSIMVFPFGANSVMTIVWPLLLYICDIHINNLKLAVYQ